MSVKTYVHYRNNLQYQIIDHCKLQVDGVWVDAYVYTTFPEIKGIHNQKYVRSVKEFHSKFKETKPTKASEDAYSFLEQVRNIQLEDILGKFKLWN